MTRCDNKIVFHAYFINKILQQIIDNENNNKRQAKTKNSVDKCQKKVSKQFKS